MKTKLEILKENMRASMCINFVNDGHLEPILITVRAGKCKIAIIPKEFMNDSLSKSIFAHHLKKMCINPDIEFVSIILEGYAKIVHKDSEISKLLSSGNIRVSELKEKDDVICMFYATPEESGAHVYKVDCKRHAILEEMKSGTNFGGLFSDFFEYRLTDEG